jgi:hypothetical protein
MFNDDYCALTKQYFFESFKQFDNVNWMIARKKEYNPKGRLQTLDEAKQLDADIHNFLLKNWVDYKLTDSIHAIEDITNDILGLPPRSDYGQMHEYFNGFPEPKKKKSWLFGR